MSLRNINTSGWGNLRRNYVRIYILMMINNCLIIPIFDICIFISCFGFIYLYFKTPITIAAYVIGMMTFRLLVDYLPKFWSLRYLNETILTKWDDYFEVGKPNDLKYNTLYLLEIRTIDGENDLDFNDYKLYCEGQFILESYFKNILFNYIISRIFFEIPMTYTIHSNINFKIISRNSIKTHTNHA